MQKISIGIDIGGTNTSLGLITQSGSIIKKINFKTNQFETVDDFVFEISLKINQLLKNTTENYELKGIGIGAPNGNYFTGCIENAVNLKWKGIIPVVYMLKNIFNTEIILTNDANAAAIGEHRYGCAKEINDFIFITLGTGLGGGIFTNGHIVNGFNGLAGEIGHTVYDINGRQCGCGRKGCLETYVSATGIVNTAKEFILKTNISLLNKFDINNLTSKDVYDSALENDELALEIFEYTGKILGMKLAELVTILNPEAIILFGGLVSSGNFINEPTKKYLDQYTKSTYSYNVKLLMSELVENEAAILGAAALLE